MSTDIFITSTITDETYSYLPGIGGTFQGGISMLDLDTFNYVTYFFNFTVVSSTIATALFSNYLPIFSGTNTFTLYIGLNDGTVVVPITEPDIVGNISIGTVNFIFSGAANPVFNSPLINYAGFAEVPQVLGSILEFDLACLHGSSLIETRDGQKRLENISAGDEILSGPNLDEYAKVKLISHCWLSNMGIDHDSIIFEAGSLGPNEPSKRLIIDPGHPMCTKAEYLENGYDALRPAGTYWEERSNDKIYSKKWTDDLVQNESSRRYDLILENPFNTYIANGMVVRAKGYKNNTYKQFV